MKVFFALVFSSIMLVACGGGGGGGTTAATPPTTTAPTPAVDPNLTVPLKAALTTLATTGTSATFTLTGWIDNSSWANPQLATPINGSGTYSLSAPTATAYKTVNLLGATEIQTTVTSSTTTSTRTFFYNIADKTDYGITTSRSTLVFQPYVVPTDVKAGSAGTLGKTSDGNFIRSYAVSSYTANSLLVVISEAYSYSITAINRNSTFIVDTTGAISLKAISEATSSLGTVYKSVTYTFIGTPPAIVLPPIRAASGTGTSTTPANTTSYQTKDAYGNLVDSNSCYQTRDSLGNLVMSSGC